MALIWLYLQINGKPNEKLLKEENIWTFHRDDFKSAVTFLMLHDEEEMDKIAIQMRELISKHFENDMQLTDWSKNIFKQVTVSLRYKTFEPDFSMYHPFKEDSFLFQLKLRMKITMFYLENITFIHYETINPRLFVKVDTYLV